MTLVSRLGEFAVRWPQAASGFGLLIGLTGAVVPALAEHLVAAVATRGSVHQPYGEEVMAGATAAAERLNAAGGVLGQAVRVVGWHEDCTRERAQQIAEEVAKLSPAVVVGHLCSGAALAAAPIYTKAGVLMIAPGVRHPGLTQGANGQRPVLRLAGRDDRFAADTIRFIALQHAGRSVAIVADMTRQAKMLAAALVAEAGRLHVRVALDERFESSEKSYDALAARIRASGAGVVLMPAQPVELGVLIAGLRRAGVDAPIVGSDILAVPSVAATARQEGPRLLLMLPWTGLEVHDEPVVHVDPTAAEAQRIAARRRAEAAVEVWAHAVRRAGTAETPAVTATARAQSAPTVLGPIGFDEAGDARIPSYVPHSWHDGGWRPVP